MNNYITWESLKCPPKHLECILEKLICNLQCKPETTFTGSFAGGVLTLNVNGVAASITLPDLDNQSLSLSGNILTISNGNTVDLTPFANIADVVTTITNNGDGTATYVNEAGTSVTFPIGSATLVNNGDGTYTFTAADSSTVTISDTSLSSLVDNGDESFTYTNEAGTITTFTVADDIVTTITDTIAGNKIATYTNELGATVDINETVITVVNNGDGTATITNEAGVATTFPIGGVAATDNGDGTYTLVLADGSTVTIADTSVSPLVVNANGTLTYTDETGVATTFSPGDSVVDNVDGTYTVTKTDGSTVIISDIIAPLVNNGDGTFTYTDEAGVSTTFTEGVAETLFAGTSIDGSITITPSGVEGHAPNFSVNFPAPQPAAVLTNNAAPFSWNTATQQGNIPTLTITPTATGWTIDLGDGTAPTNITDDNTESAITVNGVTYPIGTDFETILAAINNLLLPVTTIATDCINDEATVIIDDAGTKKLATVRQIANSTKSSTGTGLTVSDETQIFSTGGNVILPNGLCQEVTVSTTPCDASPTIVSSVKIDDLTTYTMPTGGYASASFMWDGTGYRVTKSYFKPTLSSFVIPVTNATTQNIQLNQQNGVIYNINWGDGNSTLNIADNVGANHTYTSSFTGNITLTSLCTINPKQFIATPNSFVSGDIANLLTGLTHYRNTGQNTTNGDIANLPTGLIYYDNQGQNTTNGDIANLPTGLTYYNNTGQNTTNGDISNLPTGLTIYANRGQNTTNGDIANLPTGLTIYGNTGQNTTNGNIANLPTGLIYYDNQGQNTTNGDIANLPTGLTYYNNVGQNTTNGDIANLPTGLTYYNNTGQNTTNGDIANLPIGLTIYVNTAQNTTNGDIATLPTGLIYYINQGQNTTNGDIANLPTGLTYYDNVGQNQVNSYTSGRVWASNMQRFYHEPAVGFGLTSTMVDNLLINLASTSWVSGSIVFIAGNNSPRTAASNAAVTTLQGLGVTVITN